MLLIPILLLHSHLITPCQFQQAPQTSGNGVTSSICSSSLQKPLPNCTPFLLKSPTGNR